MEQNTSENSEKTSLLARDVECNEPFNAHPKRRNAIKGVVVAALLFAWWSSIVISRLLGLDKQGNTIVVNDGLLDFADV
jgi:hypothetical protein